MLRESDLFSNNFDWREYCIKEDLNKLLGYPLDEIQDLKSDLKEKNIHLFFNVEPNKETPQPAEFDDLARLHYLAKSRKATTILEFGVGKSSIIFSDAISKNKIKWHDFAKNNLRRGNLYECHSVDNHEKWINKCYEGFPKNFIKQNITFFHKSNLIVSDFNGRICTFYDPLPNICPDLIYLDGPDQFSPSGSIRGINTAHQDRLPMAGDILSFEHFLLPGTLIIVDGRTANSRFLKANLQRNWGYYHSVEFDQHYFELQEEPLGIYNKSQIDHCLGESYFQRINNQT